MSERRLRGVEVDARLANRFTQRGVLADRAMELCRDRVGGGRVAPRFQQLEDVGGQRVARWFGAGTRPAAGGARGTAFRLGGRPARLLDLLVQRFDLLFEPSYL